MAHGCIKNTKGPWKVRRKAKDGKEKESLRCPSKEERARNYDREVQRRQVASKIFEGLRLHGNYKLPKHASRNDLLRALCEEAGWDVDDDGNISRKTQLGLMEPFGSPITSHGGMSKDLEEEAELELTLALPSGYMLQPQCSRYVDNTCSLLSPPPTRD